MTFASLQDSQAIAKEMSWGQRQIPTTIYQMLTETKDRFPDRPAVTFQLQSGPTDKAETLTWREFHTQVTQAANLFRALQAEESDSIALVLPNSTETAVAILAATVAGTASPINPLLEPEQIGAILRENQTKIVVTLKAFPKTNIAQKLAEAVRHAPQVHTVLEVDLLRYLTPPKSWIVPLIRPKNPGGHHADVKSFTREMKRQSKVLSFSDGTKDRVAALFHTGGTTGSPKVAQHRYSGMIYNGWLGGELLFNEMDTVMCPLPLFHVFACHVILMSMVRSGAHVVFPTPAGYRGEGVFDNFWKLCERWKATFIITVPTAVSALVQRKVDADISTVKDVFSGSAPMPLELFKKFSTTAGVRIIEGYGLTEATCLVSLNPIDGEKRIGSVGVPFPYCEVRIFRDTPDGPVECATDEVGEICVFNPGVWPGNTYTDIEKNRNLYYEDKYLRTGDLGRLDQDGYLWITGRAKDLIIRGGHNIDPAEIEEALLVHPDVVFAGAVGQPDSHAGELPCAYVEVVDGKTVSGEALREHCKVHVHERAAQPKYVGVLAELPKTAVGKVFKPELRKLAIQRVYNEALQEAKLESKVVEVLDDKKRGMVAILGADHLSEDQEVAKVLGAFTRPWERKSTDTAKTP